MIILVEMRITINDVPYDVYEYDDDTTILERYAMSQEDSSSSFYRIVNKDFIIENGVSLEVGDVRDEIKNISEEELRDPFVIENILISYPGLKRKDIGALWIIQNYTIEKDKVKETIETDALKSLDRIAFLTSAKAANTTLDFIKRVKKERTLVFERTKMEKRIFEALAKQKTTLTSSPFSLEEVTTQSIFGVPNGESLLDVFDALDVSRNIPFILLAHKKKVYYKVYRHIIPPQNWVDFVPPVEGLYFKVLNTPQNKLSSRQIILDNLYSNGVWLADGRVELDFKVRSNEDDVKNILFDAIGDRLVYDVVATRQTGIKGTFIVTDINFDRVVFADLVATNEYFKYFLFFNEKNKTVISKPRFYVYYAQNQQGIISNSLALTITPQIVEGKPSVIVRISHANNIQQASSARLITLKLFSLYLQEYDRIVGIYSNLIENFDVTAGKKKQQKKEDKKTGPRAAALRKIHPEMFGSRYPDQCQKERQPYVLKDEEDALQRAEELGDPHKIMLFEGTWYACEPREPYLDPKGNKDKDDKHIFPGLKENKPKTKDTDYDKEFKRKHPDLPCCFTQDQYEKKASRLRKYRAAQEEKERVELDAPERDVGGGYIVGANRRLQPGRFGELPFNWEKLLHHLGIEKVTRGKQTLYPILRYGVVASPASIIHCLERAFNPRYSSLTTFEKRDLVKNVREEMAERNLNIGRQELYDYTETDIRTMLLNDDEYLAPESFVSILQQYYDCNIFIYILDEKHVNGDIVIPRSSQAHLSRDIDELKKTVFIIKYETDTDDYPYQSEIFCHLDVKNGKTRGVNFVFENSPIVKMAVKLFYDANEVFVVSTDGYEPYRPVPEISL